MPRVRHVPRLEDPIPLFSPTQVSGGEQLLHSLFSPTFRNGLTSGIDPSQRERKKRDRVKEAARRLVAKDPSVKDGVPMRTRPAPPPPPADLKLDSPVEFMSPPAYSSDRDILHRPFFSPGYVSSPSNVSSISTFSPPLTPATVTSIQNIPIDKLSYRYVSNCDSTQDLQQIVATLSADKHYPSLLMSAKKRLQSLQDTLDRKDVVIPRVCFTEPEQQESSAATYPPSPIARPTSILRKARDPHARVHHVQGAPQTTVPIRKEPLESPHARSQDGSSLEMSLSSSSLEGVEPHFDQQQVAEDMRFLMADPSFTDEPSENYDDVNNDVQDEVAMLEKALRASVLETEEVMKALDEARQENSALEQRLKKEVEYGKGELEEVNDCRKALEQKIVELSEQLQKSEHAAVEARRDLETSLHRRYEADMALQKKNAVVLSKALNDTRHHLHLATEERDRIVQTIYAVLGKPADQFHRMTQHDKVRLIEEVSKKLASFRAATKALSKTLNTTEAERDQAVKARRVAEKRMNQSIAVIQRLETENARLTKKLHEAVEKLETSKVHLESLRNAGQTTSDWQSKEKEYLSMISTLRSQLRSGESMVSMALYRRAVSEAKARSSDCEKKRKEVKALTKKMEALEQRIKINATPKDSIKNQSAPSRRTRKITPTSTDENSCPQISAVSKSNNMKPSSSHSKPALVGTPSGTKLSYRLTAVRNSGGRSGLRAKLQKMRSPSAARTQQEA